MIPFVTKYERGMQCNLQMNCNITKEYRKEGSVMNQWVSCGIKGRKIRLQVPMLNQFVFETLHNLERRGAACR